MTQQEFKALTGLTYSESDFWKIHDLYLDSGLQKDVFCADFKKHHASVCLRDSIEMGAYLNRQAERWREQKAELASFLLGKSRVYDDPEFRREAVRLLDERSVVIMTLRAGYPLWEEDLKFILKYLEENVSK